MLLTLPRKSSPAIRSPAAIDQQSRSAIGAYVARYHALCCSSLWNLSRLCCYRQQPERESECYTRWGSTVEARARLVQVQEAVARLEQVHGPLNVPGPRATALPVGPLGSPFAGRADARDVISISTNVGPLGSPFAGRADARDVISISTNIARTPPTFPAAANSLVGSSQLAVQRPTQAGRRRQLMIGKGRRCSSS